LGHLSPGVEFTTNYIKYEVHSKKATLLKMKELFYKKNCQSILSIYAQIALLFFRTFCSTLAVWTLGNHIVCRNVEIFNIYILRTMFCEGK